MILSWMVWCYDDDGWLVSCRDDIDWMVMWWLISVDLRWCCSHAWLVGPNPK